VTTQEVPGVPMLLQGVLKAISLHVHVSLDLRDLIGTLQHALSCQRSSYDPDEIR
jgi:hypothetical protein